MNYITLLNTKIYEWMPRQTKWKTEHFSKPVKYCNAAIWCIFGFMFGNFEAMIFSISMLFVYGGNRRANHYFKINSYKYWPVVDQTKEIT